MFFAKKTSSGGERNARFNIWGERRSHLSTSHGRVSASGLAVIAASGVSPVEGGGHFGSSFFLSFARTIAFAFSGRIAAKGRAVRRALICVPCEGGSRRPGSGAGSSHSVSVELVHGDGCTTVRNAVGVSTSLNIGSSELVIVPVAIFQEGGGHLGCSDVFGAITKLGAFAHTGRVVSELHAVIDALPLVPAEGCSLRLGSGAAALAACEHFLLLCVAPEGISDGGNVDTSSIVSAIDGRHISLSATSVDGFGFHVLSRHGVASSGFSIAVTAIFVTIFGAGNGSENEGCDTFHWV